MRIFAFKGLFRYVLSVLAVFCIFCGVAYAISSPVAMMQSVANKMVSQLDRNQSQLKTSRGPAIISSIVNRTLIPAVDLYQMAGQTVGRHHWQQASSSQKRAFINKFKKLLIKNYSAALSSFDDDKVEFYRMRANYKTAKTVRVRSVIVRRSGQKIGISYNLVRKGSSWKVYDFSIEGVSVVQSYRSQFASILSRGGVAELIKRL